MSKFFKIIYYVKTIKFSNSFPTIDRSYLVLTNSFLDTFPKNKMPNIFSDLDNSFTFPVKINLLLSSSIKRSSLNSENISLFKFLI